MSLELVSHIRQQSAAAEKITQTLLDAYPDYGLFINGGSVRDALLGLPALDLDLLVEANLDTFEVEDLLEEAAGGRTAGLNFRTMKLVRWNADPNWGLEGEEDTVYDAWDQGEHIDVVLLTAEQAMADHPAISSCSNSDFTINAMALDVRSGQLIDPTGGQQDLEQRLLRRAGGDWADGFGVARALRGLRFIARFDLHVEAQTAQLMIASLNEMRAMDPMQLDRLFGRNCARIDAGDPGVRAVQQLLATSQLEPAARRTLARHLDFPLAPAHLPRAAADSDLTPGGLGHG